MKQPDKGVVVTPEVGHSARPAVDPSLPVRKPEPRDAAVRVFRFTFSGASALYLAYKRYTVPLAARSEARNINAAFA